MFEGKTLPYPVWPSADTIAKGWHKGLRWPGKAVHRGETSTGKDVIQVLVRMEDGFLKLVTWQVYYFTDVNPVPEAHNGEQAQSEA